MPPHLIKSSTGTLGLRLIKGLSDNLEANFEINVHEGTSVTVIFKKAVSLL